jgi:DNA invertase Pin-like site-specific DNA recombinase
LEQSFNSLDAQREACAAYILSQAGEGWTMLPRAYDDGGFSGGNMERPGLQALLAVVRAGEIDVVVVYKVDRLTRSLADFARIVELFDQHQVSFVSVTQSFNTTSSMGRLTLNVLLSFAQFEREVTGERIRDKIAASKAKGLWMGGRPPLGYDAKDQKLVVNQGEAEVVCRIFRRYLELGTVTALTIELRDMGVRSKRWMSRKGVPLGGAVFTRGALYHLLSNPVYRGAIAHRDRRYDGAHQPIIETSLWDEVQSQLAANGNATPDTARVADVPQLQGLLYDDRGHRMGPLHTLRRGRRYRYYASAALKPASGQIAGSLPRIAVGVLDEFLMSRLVPALDETWRMDLEPRERLRQALRRVTLGAARIEARLATSALAEDAVVAGARVEQHGGDLVVSFSVRLKHRQGALVVAATGDLAKAKVDRALVRALCLARSWSERLSEGSVGSLKALAEAEGYCDHYAARLAPLAWLAPDLAEQILEGRQPAALSLAALTKTPLPTDWDEQRRVFASFA